MLLIDFCFGAVECPKITNQCTGVHIFTWWIEISWISIMYMKIFIRFWEKWQLQRKWLENISKGALDALDSTDTNSNKLSFVHSKWSMKGVGNVFHNFRHCLNCSSCVTSLSKSGGNFECVTAILAVRTCFSVLESLIRTHMYFTEFSSTFSQ